MSNPISFDHNDVTYTIPPAEDWTVDALEAFEDGKLATLLREILGEQWAAFKATKPKVSDLAALFASAEKVLNAGN